MKESRRRYSSKTGWVAETRFKRAAEELGLKVMKSRSSEDIHMHVDYWLSFEGGSNHALGS